MITDLRQIDSALQDRIKDHVPQVRNVSGLAHEDEVLEPRPGDLPAVLTLVNGATFDPPAGVSRYQEGEVRVTIFVQTEHLGGDGLALRGDGGAYDLTVKCVDALLGYAPAGCGPLELVAIETLTANDIAAVIRVEMAASTEEMY